MSTPPLPAATLAKLQARGQAVRWGVTLAEVRQFAAYCCQINSDDIMGVSKQPVPVLSISPNPVCLGEDITWSFAGSYAPGSTITSRVIDFGDGNSDDPAGTSGTHTYAAAGAYTITATVTEGTGLSQSITREVNVIDCPDGLLISFVYQTFYGGGVYFRDYTVSPPAWEARNGGLAGTALDANYLTLRPGDAHLSDTVHELLLAADGGLYFSENGGRQWGQFSLPDPSNAEFSDSPAAVIADLTFDWVDYDPLNLDTIYARGVYAANGRLWIYKSTDAGVNWTSRGVVTT
jgi:plastocyanin